MAYTASIAIAVKGIQDLQALRQKIEAAAEGVNKFNNFAKEAFGGDFVRSLNNVKNALVSASNAFDDAALGTSRAVDAAKAYIAANREMNATLKERERLLRAVISAEGAEAMVRIGVRPGASQRLLPAAAPGSPAMSGGARSLITGPVERLGGARTADEAATALRFAQALNEQVRPLSQIQALYAGISQQAASMSRIKALPDSAMLNATSRGIIQLETAQDRYNRELGESAQRLQQLDRIEASRERRAAKLRKIQEYYAGPGTPGTMTNAGFGIQGPALPPKGLPRKGAGGASSSVVMNAILGGAFPALFGGGPGAILGGVAGGAIGGGMGGLAGMALSIAFSAVGQSIDTMVAKMRELGNAAKLIDIPKLRESSLFINQKLATTLELLKAAGKEEEARALIQREIFQQTGMIPEFLTKSTESANLLNNAWQKFSGALGAASSILGAAIVPLVTTLVSAAAKLLQYFNFIASTIGNLISNALDNVIKRSKFFRFIIERILNDTTAKTEEESAAQLEATKQQLEQQQKIRDAFLTRIQTQKDATVLLKKLNGELLTDGYRLLELDNELQKNNEERYAVLKRIEDLKGAGGRAAGFGDELNKAEAKLAELQNKKIELEIQVKQESLARFEAEIKAAGDRATRALELQAGAVRGRETIAQSQFTLQKSLNDLYSQRLDMEVQLLEKGLEQTTNLAQQEAIFDRLREINHIRYQIAISNAKIERASTYSQIRSNLELLAIEVRKQEIAFKVAQAVMFEAKAKGLLNQSYIDAVDAQYDALQLSIQSYNYAVRNAAIQERIADVTYQQKIEAAGFARNMELAAINARQTQAAATATASALSSSSQYGQGLDQTLVLGRTYMATGQSFTVPRKMATGGFVNSPTFAMIAEAGQGEYVVPESKAANFAMNYMMGSRGAAAIDGNAGSPTVNITTGPVMQQDGQIYVTMQDFEQGLQTMANSLLGNNRSAGGRRYAGVA